MINEVVIPFRGQEVLAVRDQDGNVWISVKRICENIGIDPKRQRAKLEGDTRFNWGHMTSVAEDGKQREMFCIPLEQLNGWLFTINANKVREDIKPRLIAYQKECMDVLYKHFMPRGEQDLSGFMDRFDQIDRNLERIDGICRGLRDEVDELRAALSLYISDDDAKVLRELIRDYKAMMNCDGRAVVGELKSTFNVQMLYGNDSTKKIIRYLRKRLGRIPSIVKNIEE